MADNGDIRAINELTDGDQVRFLEIVDQAAPPVLMKDVKFVATLGDISSEILKLPHSIGSLRGLKKTGTIAVASGGTTDIWRGDWNGKPVAFKAFRIYPPQDLLEAKRIIWRMAPIWKRLVHENVLPFHGVDMSMFQLALVYEWGHNGNIMQYLGSNPKVSRPQLLLQVAKGLQYLHSLDVIHGDLKGANVLISASGNAQVCDYGLSTIISDPSFTIAATPGVAGSSRWLAPEIIDPPNKATPTPMTASKAADVFAFAMLAVEVFTGKVPFSNLKNESVVIQIVGGKRPEKPQAAEQLGLTAEMWKFIEKCWNANPNKRPSINEVVRTWEGFVNGGTSRTSVPMTQGRRSNFAEPSTVHNEKPVYVAPRKRRLCGLC